MLSRWESCSDQHQFSDIQTKTIKAFFIIKSLGIQERKRVKMYNASEFCSLYLFADLSSVVLCSFASG